ncbi:hypothetical protein PVAND_008101 [Polypedilum vanderplanki]|uniref:S-adenosylmethionine sensor upstream of mTORC1 n=1 Tax=Polypedilum vanderplanki TaxID=319348 RepID=A0A9J6C9I6_POLVA|nr:hypothetical protein PVAND_008101 [Polypedilum vanderplanki]
MENKFEEQKKLATIIKGIHQSLRETSDDIGDEKAWENHLKDREKLNLYANSMRTLSESHWKEKIKSKEDRIEWIIESCNEYFTQTIIEEHRNKEMKILEKLKLEGYEIKIDEQNLLKIGEKLKVVDVGSSGNFFKKNDRFEILPLDIAPASDEVLYCDFLSVSISNKLSKDAKMIHSIPTNYFDVVIFCLLLEYLPSSNMRIKCCENAYEILKTEGILCLITPDSNFQHTNAQQIKNWKWTLANIGFKRIKLEKLMNLTCMIFRKSLSKEITKRWVDLKKEPKMEFKMDIPQDRKKKTQEHVQTDVRNYKFDIDIMNELPFE